MVVHGIYLKSRPKGKWHLMSVSASPEAAEREFDEILKNSILQGNDGAQAGIQIFDSVHNIPESLSELKVQKVLYN